MYIGEGNGAVRISVYDKREDFSFKIVNFPYLDSNIPRNPAYGVYISQLVRYARICSRKDDFIYRHRRLSLKLQQQGYKYQQLVKSFHKFYRSLRRVKEVWNNADRTTIFDLKRSPCRVYPFELYLNLFLCVFLMWLCFYFLSLFDVLFVFPFFVRACLYHCVVYSADVGRILYI